MARTFEKALQQNALPKRLGDVQLKYETTMWLGLADRPDRGLIASVSLVVGVGGLVAALTALLTRADTETVAFLLVPCVAGFVGAAWLEQRDRRQRKFAVDFDAHVLRLDFSTPLSGMPRTLRVPFEVVRDIALEEQGRGQQVLTVDFELENGLFREVLIAAVTADELPQCERVKRMLRAAVGLERPAIDEPRPGASGPPPVVDSFG